MTQLVGQKCALCQRPISSIAEGDFCSACSCPIHLKCVRSGSDLAHRCAACGAEADRGIEHRQRQQEEATVRETEVRAYFLTSGVGLIIVGALCVVAGMGVSLLSVVAAQGGGFFVIF